MDLKNFTSAISQIAEEKGISAEKVIESIETAIAAAYKKDYGKKGQIIKAKLDPKTGKAKFWQVKLVVSDDMIYSEEELEELKEKKPVSAEALTGKKEEAEEEKKVRFNPEKHIMIEEAKKIKPGIKPCEELETPLKAQKDYGRIAAQTAKQVILQKIREAERETIFSEYKEKEGEIISGVVQRIEGRNVFIDVGKTLGILAREEQVVGEFYRPGQRLKAYILRVEETPKGPVVFLSRAYPKFVSKLFELEVPEISQGTVAIKSIAREPGSRTKIAVEAKEEGIDPIGSAVGQRGTRVMAVINELGGEKIDIIEYSEDPERFIANALSPAKVLEVKQLPQNKALCLVPEDQLSLAIGKEGQNVRLAAKLTGWKIDVKAPEKKEEEEPKKGETKKEEKKEEKKKTAKEKKEKKKEEKGKTKTKK
jgi:N utilization substance protein A